MRIGLCPRRPAPLVKRPMKHRFLFLIPLLCLTAAAIAEPMVVPAATAYSEPGDRGGPRREKDGRITGWKSGRDSLAWFGHFATPGTVDVKLELAAPSKAQAWEATWSAQQGGEKASSRPVESKADESSLVLGRFTVAKPGYYRLTLRAAGTAGEPLPESEIARLRRPRHGWSALFDRRAAERGQRASRLPGSPCRQGQRGVVLLRADAARGADRHLLRGLRLAPRATSACR